MSTTPGQPLNQNSRARNFHNDLSGPLRLYQNQHDLGHYTSANTALNMRIESTSRRLGSLDSGSVPLIQGVDASAAPASNNNNDATVPATTEKPKQRSLAALTRPLSMSTIDIGPPQSATSSFLTMPRRGPTTTGGQTTAAKRGNVVHDQQHR